uniref:Protein FAM217B n=1 Tax=Castor canadensis TaxID=51338 RepID=A0A8C0WLV9_CASCN
MYNLQRILQGKRQSKSQVPHVSSRLRSSLADVSQPGTERHKESICTKGKPGQNAFSTRSQGASGNKLFMDFQSMKIIEEDADGDSASDLSDSERIPIPPSPLTPPDLNLRAEEIDPVSFNLYPSEGCAKTEYHYPDFLPPPFSSWDLRDIAMLPNTECKVQAVSHTGGLLGKYLDRLIQLEWLQIQTVQCEKGRGGKARPPVVPGASGALKSPGRSKLLASTLCKPLPYREGTSKSGLSRKKAFPYEELHPSCCSFEASSRPVDSQSCARLCSQKPTPELRTGEKKKKSSRSSKLQRWDLPCSGCNPKMEASGNIRVPKQSAMILDPVDSCGAARTQTHVNLKKKGNGNNCGRATVASEKKLKTNGVKQKACKLK